MIKNAKKINMIALIILGIGVVLLLSGIVAGGKPGFYFTRNVSNGKFKLVTSGNKEEKVLKKTSLDSFSNIKIDTKYKDIIFKESDDFAIEYKTSEIGITYKVENDTLSIRDEYEATFFNFFNMDFYNNQEYVIIYLPADAMMTNMELSVYEGDLNVPNVTSSKFTIDQDYGDFKGENLDTDDFTLTIYEGDTSIENLTSGKVDIKGKYGDLSMNQVTVAEDGASNNMKINFYEGDIAFRNVTGTALQLNTRYGDITGESLNFTEISAETYEAETTLKELVITKFDMQSKYGDINLGIVGAEHEYSFSLTSDYGDINLNNKNRGESYHSTSDEKNSITIDSYEGDQNITTK